MSLISFGSDNHSGVHPLLFDEMQKINKAYAPSYEQDQWSQDLKKILLKEFRAHDCALVFNGTAANVLCLQMATESFNSVLCSDVSHIHVDECGAPEKIAGVKIMALPSQQGKISAASIEKALIRQGDQHFSQVKVVSLTQPTEYGTLYTKQELSDIRALCDQHKLFLHMDGARLPNAAVALNQSLGETTEVADLISFGGAKNGLMLGEYVILKNPLLKKGLKFFRKQSLQLPSKTRFLTAPFLKYLQSGLWKEIAQHENQVAQYLGDQLSQIDPVQITQPTEANSVFCILPKEVTKKLKKKFFFYVWDEHSFEIRLMTSFSTQKADVDAFILELKSLLKERNHE